MTINNEIYKLKELATKFRTAIMKCKPKTPLVSFQNFPYGACGDASLLLAKYFNDNNCGDFYYVLGYWENKSHAWLQKGDIIIDITANQFNDQNASVIFMKDNKWHSKHTVESKEIADFTKHDSYSVSLLSNTYKIITEHL
jgi:hypothetical protein